MISFENDTEAASAKFLFPLVDGFDIVNFTESFAVLVADHLLDHSWPSFASSLFEEVTTDILFSL